VGKFHQLEELLAVVGYTPKPPKINIEPENDDLEDDFSIPGVLNLRFHVNLPGVYVCWN